MSCHFFKIYMQPIHFQHSSLSKSSKFEFKKLGVIEGLLTSSSGNIEIQAKLFFKLNEKYPIASEKCSIYAVALVRG